jgi:oligopeptide transport system substrate-binding protein
MMRRPSLSLALLTAGTALLAAAGFAHAAGGVGETRRGGTLRLATFQDVDHVDTALAYSGWSWPIGYATCAKLFNHPDESGAAGTRVIPEVVERYGVSKDGRTYTFDLKRTFRFHTGAGVTARSFADAFNRDAEPRLRSPATSFMHEIEGADAVIDGKAKTISGVRVLGRYRLQIRLTKPLGDFIARLTLPFFCPILPKTPIDPNGIDNPAGSGPYYVAERVVNQRIVLRRNPYYRGSRPANVDQVVWTIGDTQESCLRATEEDRIDHCAQFGVPPAAYRALAEKYGINRPGGQFFVRSQLTTWYLAFNHDRPAFNGPGQIPLKKAINYAIDRPALARAFGYLGGKRTDQILPPGLGRAESIYPLGGPNLGAAKGWYARARLKPTTLVYYSTNAPGSVVQAQILEFNLKQLGIDLEVKYFDAGTLLEKISTRGEPFDLARNGWAVDYADGGSFFSPHLEGSSIQPTGNLNVAYFDDPQTNARIDAANRLTGEARRKAWEDLDVRLMRDNPPWAPLIHSNSRSFVSKSFGCFLHHPLYGVDIAAACKR